MNDTPQPAGRTRTAWTGACLTLFAVALGLRVWGTGFGLPYVHHWDEAPLLNRAADMARTGSLDPRNYEYPALWFWAEAAALKIADRVVPGFDLREVAPLSDHRFLHWENRQPEAYRWLRWQAALWGAATVVVAADAARLVAGPLAGVTAGAMLAVMPHHLFFSRFAMMDGPAGLPVALALRAAAAGVASGGAVPLSAWIWAGLAAAMKYQMAVAGAALLLAVRPRPPFRRAALGVLIGFTLGHPFWLLKPDRVFQSVAGRHLSYAGAGGTSVADQAHALLEGIGLPGLGLAALAALARGTGAPGRLTAAAAGLPLLAAALMARYPVAYPRNLAPVLPAVAVLGGIGASALARRAGRGAGIAAAVVAVGLTAWGSHRRAWWRLSAGGSDTRTLAAEWIARHVPPDARLFVDAEIRLAPSEFGARPPARVDWHLSASLAAASAPGARYLLTGRYETGDPAGDRVYAAAGGAGGHMTASWDGSPIRLTASEPIINPQLMLVERPRTAPADAPGWPGFPLHPPARAPGSLGVAPGAVVRWEEPLPPGRYRLTGEIRAGREAPPPALAMSAGTLGAPQSMTRRSVPGGGWRAWTGPEIIHTGGRVEIRFEEISRGTGLLVRRLRMTPILRSFRQL